ncbi:hypothetical protein Dalk_1877 [Desulfatibacillum aliphaticivorans]|uniref:Uncharacterized protein n=1 Tax=Desulfatibacillum aliphaticivorans TaxID=218208 RepID=B8FEP7_DESAL|nr:hypothetical protein Dalk_1877 [Desulfatibacillum aliphaticivorans]
MVPSPLAGEGQDGGELSVITYNITPTPTLPRQGGGSFGDAGLDALHLIAYCNPLNICRKIDSRKLR